MKELQQHMPYNNDLFWSKPTIEAPYDCWCHCSSGLDRAECSSVQDGSFWCHERWEFLIWPSLAVEKCKYCHIHASWLSFWVLAQLESLFSPYGAYLLYFNHKVYCTLQFMVYSYTVHDNIFILYIYSK